MNNDFAFCATGVDNFSPLFVKSIFAKDSSKHFTVWVTLYTCAGTRGVILVVVPHTDSSSFIKSFRRFVSRRGCPSVTISDNGRNFVSNEIVEFMNGLGVDWRLNMPLAWWHGVVFERMVRSTKTLLRKTLQTAKLLYEELQTVLYEAEQIINYRPITYYYSDNEESCLTSNHLLYGRTIKYSNLLTGELITPRKFDNLLSHFWERWRKEYLVNLRESRKTAKPATTKGKHPTVQIGDVFVMEEGNMCFLYKNLFLYRHAYCFSYTFYDSC